LWNRKCFGNGFVGFCCFDFDPDFELDLFLVFHFLGEFDFVNRNVVHVSIFYLYVFSSFTINFLLGCREIRGNVKNTNCWILGAIVLYIRFSFVIPFSPVKMEHNWNVIAVTSSSLFIFRMVSLVKAN